MSLLIFIYLHINRNWLSFHQFLWWLSLLVFQLLNKTLKLKTLEILPFSWQFFTLITLLRAKMPLSLPGFPSCVQGFFENVIILGFFFAFYHSALRLGPYRLHLARRQASFLWLGVKEENAGDQGSTNKIIKAVTHVVKIMISVSLCDLQG